MIPMFIPSLLSTLRSREKAKGAPLTESEVLEVRHRAASMMLRLSEAAKLVKSRGYEDLDPDQCWAQWQEMRKELPGPGGA